MNNIATIDQNRAGVIDGLARHFDMDKANFLQVMKATIMKGANVSGEDIAAFCLVAKEHGLNPFTKEIFAFPTGGGIQPIVSIDGWMKLINSHPDFDGMEFVDTLDANGKITAITCKMFRKGRSHPTSVTEYLSECFRQTPTWKQWPTRMLRHKVTIQAARYTFGFAGIMEPDEAERMGDPIRVDAVRLVSEGQAATIRDEMEAGAIDPAVILALYEVASVDDVPAKRYAEVIATIKEASDAASGA